MLLNRARRDEEPLPDRLVRAPLRHQLEDLTLARRQPLDRVAAPVYRDEVGHDGGVEGAPSFGDPPGRPWSIAIRDPRREDGVVALLPLEDTAISTSGDYERYFERDGVRCHHLIDPRTGRSPDTVRSVTILAADGLTAEALSKTVFVLGVERGLALLETLDGVDAVVVDAQGALHYSSGLLSGSPHAVDVARQ